MARHAKVLQLLRDDKGICNASFRIIAQFYNAIRLRYMRIVFVFDFTQNFLLREFNYGISSLVSKMRTSRRFRLSSKMW